MSAYRVGPFFFFGWFWPVVEVSRALVCFLLLVQSYFYRFGRWDESTVQGGIYAIGGIMCVYIGGLRLLAEGLSMESWEWRPPLPFIKCFTSVLY